MNDVFREYKELIQQIKEAPLVSPPSDITQRVMGLINDEKRLSLWHLLRQTLAEAGQISWARFMSENAQARNACFYFMIAGLFFFFIGSVLFSSVFYIEYASKVLVFILLQSSLVLVSAISLVTGGMMVAFDIPGYARGAKKAIMVYVVLMTLCAILIAVVVKTSLGGLLATTFTVAGIVTGMTLMKALDNRLQGSKGCFNRGLNNA